MNSDKDFKKKVIDTIRFRKYSESPLIEEEEEYGTKWRSIQNGDPFDGDQFTLHKCQRDQYLFELIESTDERYITMPEI